MGIDVVWYKRDLRIGDHRPLRRACQKGPVVCLYIYEPMLFEHREFDTSRLVFLNQSLRELDASLRERGGRLVFRVGAAVDVLNRLHNRHRIDRLWSHQETGSARTFRRDLAVGDWCQRRHIQWTEIPQHGVFRPLPSRDGWADRWHHRMSTDVQPPVEAIDAVDDIDSGQIRDADDLWLDASTKDEALPGGQFWGHYMLDSFLDERGVNYRSDMSSPATAWDGCSRISPYLAFGNLSMREVWQRTRQRIESLRTRRDKGEQLDGPWLSSLSSFESRLHWHGHFMQKLEDEPRIEFENFARAYDGIRRDYNDEYLEAWKVGATGFPMVDACMRALHAGGWINFRMRAMLVSFASYHLWIHWRPTGQHLAKHFLDFEAGIHWPQMQMQSGTTGINSIRIYNPTKQVDDHDPSGTFIRQYIPELQSVPDEYIAAPWKMPDKVQQAFGCVIGRDYPEPIVDGKQAWKRARDRIWEIKQSPGAKAEADKIYERHGSRK